MDTTSTIPVWLQVLLAGCSLSITALGAVAAWKAAGIARAAFDWERRSTTPRLALWLSCWEQKPSMWHLMAENIGPVDAHDIEILIREVNGPLEYVGGGTDNQYYSRRWRRFAAGRREMLNAFNYNGDESKESGEQVTVSVRVRYRDALGNWYRYNQSLSATQSTIGQTEWDPMELPVGEQLVSAIEGLLREFQMFRQFRPK